MKFFSNENKSELPIRREDQRAASRVSSKRISEEVEEEEKEKKTRHRGGLTDTKVRAETSSEVFAYLYTASRKTLSFSRSTRKAIYFEERRKEKRNRK